MEVSTLVYVTIAVALIFDVINGFHDAANSIATIVSTRVLSPRLAVIWATFFNFVALFIFHEGVANTISKIVAIQPADHAFVSAISSAGKALAIPSIRSGRCCVATRTIGSSGLWAATLLPNFISGGAGANLRIRCRLR